MSEESKKLPLITAGLKTMQIIDRGLPLIVCEKYRYQVGENYKGDKVHVAPYYWKGKLVAQHTRGANKTFMWLGDTSQIELFGQHLCSGFGRLIITEGEIDAMSVCHAFAMQYADVVSVPSGAQSAEKYIKMNLEFVEGYKEIILCLDNDAPGQEATQKLMNILSPGKTKIVSFPEGFKDANDFLKVNRKKDLLKCIYDAQATRPDGILAGYEVPLEEVIKPISRGIPYRYPILQRRTQGARKGELTLWTAGSGVGKSTNLREIAYDYRKLYGTRIAMVYLEENYRKTIQGFIGIDNNVPLWKIRQRPDCINGFAYEKSYNELIASDGIFFYNHFGSLDAQNLIAKLRYLIKSCDVEYIFLDHISIVVSGNQSNDERKDIDILMTSLRSLVEETGVGIHAVVHLKRNGNNFNEGGKVGLTDLRGSGSLEQLSDNVIALERNQQGNENEKNVILIRVLKCRETGDTGEAGHIIYNTETGRMEVPKNEDIYQEPPPPEEDDIPF